MISLKQKKVILLLISTVVCFIFHLFWIVPLTFADDNVAQANQIKIEIKETNNLSSATVFLGDIAVIFANPFLVENIKNIEIGAAPKPGEIAVIDKRKIVFQLKSQKYLSKNFTLIGPEKIFVKRLGQAISKQTIKGFIRQQLDKKYPNKTYQIKQFKVRGLESYPTGTVSFSIDVEKLVDKRGRLSCYLDVMVNNIQSDRLSISGIVAVYKNIVFAGKSLLKGDMLSIEDVYTKKGNIFNFHSSAIRTADVVVGKILKNSIRKDACLTESILSDPPLVKKGDIVTLISKNKNLRIVTSGISMEDGFINELVKVENFHSGKLIRGIVTEKSKVEVVY